MINFNIYVANIPKQESIVNVMKNNKTDGYVFIAPETIEWLLRILKLNWWKVMSFFFLKDLTRLKLCYIISPAKD